MSLRGLPLVVSMGQTDQTTKTEEARWAFNRKTGPALLTWCPFLLPEETRVFSPVLSECGNCKKETKMYLEVLCQYDRDVDSKKNENR